MIGQQLLVPGRYGTIIADPPWRYTKDVSKRKPANIAFRYGRTVAESHYDTMLIEDIAALPVGEMAAEQSHLYLWVTNPVLCGGRPGVRTRVGMTAFDVVKEWGFEPMTILTWVKTGRLGLGWYFRGQTEHVIFAQRGEQRIPAHLRVPNVFYAPARGHSRKPEVLMDTAERVSPGPYLELFSRRTRIGWDSWGREALNHVELVAP